MKRVFKISFLSIALSSILMAELSLTERQEKSLVKTIMPSTKIEKVDRAVIDGFYKAYLKNGNILYVNPYNRAIFIGDIYTAGGINVSAQEREEWKNELNKAILKSLNAKKLTEHSEKIIFGKGSKDYQFVIFTDPECPFCNQVEKFLSENNATIYANFYPLSFHQNAKKWSLEILSSKDHKEAMLKIQKTQKDLGVEITKEAEEQLTKMMSLGETLEIQGTPKIYVISGDKVVDIIEGANIPKLEKYLKGNSNDKK